MKISAKQYALSLYESLVNKENKEVKGVIKRFVELLALNNDILKADIIVSEFLKIWNDKEKIVEAEVISSNKLDKEIVSILENYIKKKSGAKNVLINEKQKKDIKGGFIIKYGDKILDNSLKTSLETLKNKMMLSPTASPATNGAHANKQ